MSEKIRNILNDEGIDDVDGVFQELGLGLSEWLFSSKFIVFRKLSQGSISGTFIVWHNGTVPGAPRLDGSCNENLTKTFLFWFSSLFDRNMQQRSGEERLFGFGGFIFPESKVLRARRNVNLALVYTRIFPLVVQSSIYH